MMVRSLGRVQPNPKTAVPTGADTSITGVDTSITVASNTPVTADSQRVGAPGSLLSVDVADATFGDETNAGFLMLAEGVASPTLLNFFGDNAVLGSTSPGAEVAQNEKNSAATLLAERPRDLVGVDTPETDVSSSQIYSVASTIFSAANESNTTSLVSTADDVAQAPVAALPVTVAAGAVAAIDGASAQSVTFAGTTGTLLLNDAVAFTGQVSGLAGSDAIDLADVCYGANTQATFSGNTGGGTLTITNGTQTASIALQGDYLSSYWTVSSDGNGGTVVVDPVASNNWQDLKVGAGGWLTGIDIAPNGTMVVRTDTYGAYIWNGTQWQQLVTSTSMPAAFVAANYNSGNLAQGVYEIQIAPSNSSDLYMMYDGYVFASTNDGTTWTQTSFAQVTESPGDAYRMNGQKMAVDPYSPNVVVVGTPQNGLFITTNAGATWQSVSGVPVSLTDSNGTYPGIDGIEFDPALIPEHQHNLRCELWQWSL